MVPGKVRKHERLEKACTCIEEGSKQCSTQFIHLFAACLELHVESKETFWFLPSASLCHVQLKDEVQFQ